MSLFAALRERQRAAFHGLVAHISAVAGLCPPLMATKRVAAWGEEAFRCVRGDGGRGQRAGVQGVCAAHKRVAAWDEEALQCVGLA